MMPRLLPLSLLLLPYLLAGCASSSVLTPWPEQAATWRSLTASNQTPIAIEQLSAGTRGRDQLLFLQERARLAQIAGDFQQSQEDFSKVIRLYDNQDADAYIAVSGLGATGAALLTNDNALPYRGDDHERIMVHGFQALNYWALGDLEAASVEFRRISQEQEVAAQRRARALARAESETPAPPENSTSPTLPAGLDQAAASVRNSIQNAYFYYLAGVFREGTGDYNNALVDYRKALQIHPESSLLRQDNQRVSDRMDGRYDDPQQGTLIIAYEQDLVPPRREVSLPIPTDHGYFAVAFPTYDPTDQVPPRPLHILSAAGHRTSTQPLANISAMAARALRERMPLMLVRQTLRANIKYQTQKKANDDFGLLGAFATQLYNLVSERADLRSWLSLPAHGQVARLTLPAGEHVVTLSSGSATSQLVLPIGAGTTTVVWVNNTGGTLSTHTLPVLEKTP